MTDTVNTRTDATNNDTAEREAIVRWLSPEQIEAALEGRVRECYVNHPVGTRCPICAKWPFKKGGAAAFVSAVRDHLKESTHE